MKTPKLVLLLFLIFAILYVIGSFFEIYLLYMMTNYLVAPSLLIYYSLKTEKIFWPVVVIILCFYLRDLLMMYSLQNYMLWIMSSFVLGMVIWYLCAVTSFWRSKMHTIEFTSLVIMYGFLGFLTFSMSEVVAEVIPTYAVATYIYLIMLTTLVGLTFTKYLFKSHWASLWLMIGSSALLVSEISMFFKMYILEDVSVNLFYPIFHVFMFYCLIQFALYRRKTGRLLFF